MAQNPHEYLIEQLQFTGDESVGSSSNKIKLNFNHPCKELIFVVQPDANVDYCSSFLKNTNLNMALGAQPFNYTDALDALVPSIAAFAGYDTVAGGCWDHNAAFITASTGMFQDPGADTLPLGSQWGIPQFALARHALCLLCRYHSRFHRLVILAFRMLALSCSARPRSTPPLLGTEPRGYG